MAKTRDYLFDNYKVFLIFLVVTGHFIGPSAVSNEFLRILKWIIVSFHMPAFIFISGYFSKKELPLTTIIQRFAVPYVVYEIIYYLWYTFITHKETGLRLLKPKFTLWYLLALFLWKLITPYVKKIPYHIIWASIAGLLIGFSTMDDNFLTIPRALVFYPYYLAGIAFDKDQLSRLRATRWKTYAAVCVVSVIILLSIIGVNRYAPMQIFYGRYNYAFMKQGIFEGIVWRMFSYLIGFAMTFSILALIPEKQNRLSYIGTRTMAIYLFHGLTYTYLEQCTSILENRNSVIETILFLAGCAMITLIFSLKPFTRFTNLFSNLHFKKKTETAN